MWLSMANLPGESLEVWGFLTPSSDAFLTFHGPVVPVSTPSKAAVKAELVPEAMPL